MCTSNTIPHFWRHLPLLNAARGKLGGTLAPIPKPMSAPQQPTPTFVLTVKTIIGGQSENRLKVSSKRLSAVRFSPRKPHVWTFPAKASRKGPRNLLSCDQSVMAKTMSENAPLKSFAKASRKSAAVRCGSLWKAPQPPRAQHQRIVSVGPCDGEHAVNSLLQKISGSLLANDGSIRGSTRNDAQQPRSRRGSYRL